MPSRDSAPVAKSDVARPVRRHRSLVGLAVALVTFAGVAAAVLSRPTDPPDSDDSMLVLTVIPMIDGDLKAMNAVNDAVERCMINAGFLDFDYPELTPATYLVSTGEETPIRVSQAFTVFGDPLDQYRRVAAASLSETPTFAVDALAVDELSPDEAARYWEALSGPSGNNGGCIGTGIEDVYGSIVAYDLRRTVIGLLPREIDLDALKPRGTAHALRVWRNCMQERGFSFSTPVEALSDVLVDDAVWEAIVSADTECKRVSELPMWYAAEWVTIALQHGVTYADLESAAAVTLGATS
jgi:hypothetical protein